MDAPQDSPRSRPHPGQQWEESSAKFHLSDVFTTLSIILIITIPHEGDLSMIFGRAEAGMGTEGWGQAFLSVLSQTRELPNNYHFLVIGTTHRLICWSKFTYLLDETPSSLPAAFPFGGLRSNAKKMFFFIEGFPFNWKQKLIKWLQNGTETHTQLFK